MATPKAGPEDGSAGAARGAEALLRRPVLGRGRLQGGAWIDGVTPAPKGDVGLQSGVFGPKGGCLAQEVPSSRSGFLFSRLAFNSQRLCPPEPIPGSSRRRSGPQLAHTDRD